MKDEYKQRFTALIELHNEFSRAYKAVEKIVKKMDVSTLNEVRYALRAFIDCVEVAIGPEPDDEKFLEAASAAELGLRIAWHDVVDITFDSFRIYLDDLGKEFGPDIVGRFIDIAACGALINTVDELVKESRGDRNRRVELYQQITNEHIDEFNRLFNEAKGAEGAISAASKKDKSDQFFKKAGLITAICFGTIGMAVGSAMVYANYFMK